MALKAPRHVERDFEFLVVLMSVLSRLIESPRLKETPSAGELVNILLVKEKAL